MLQITLKDGSKLEVQENSTCAQVAAMISPGLARMALAAQVDGEVRDLSTPLTGDCTLNLLTNDADALRTLRHTASHVLAQAVKALFPETKLAIGPAIDTGFYYDFDVEKPFTPEDLERLEAKMKELVKAAEPLERFELPRQEAIAYMEGRDEPYKVELIQDLPEDAVISFYRQGDFVDLCAGPHVPDTGRVKVFKLLNCTGAYWRGDSNRKMLQRIYGTAFFKKDELKEYLERLEEAKRRDHRRLGRELNLFTLMDEGPGFPFFLPKGMVVKLSLIHI